MVAITRVNKVQEGFEPNSKQINYIKGLIASFADSEWGSKNNWFPDVEWGLVEKAVSAADARTDELIAAGFVQQNDYDRGNARAEKIVTTLNLTDSGVEWAMEHLGMPDPSDLEALDEFAKGGEFERKPEPRKGAKPGIKNTSAFVAQERYTKAEAAAAMQVVEAAYAKNEITERSAAGYKAHITRRTVIA